MSILEHENATATTEHWAFSYTTISDQSNVVTRRFVFFDMSSLESETREIERNPEFHSTIVSRLARPAAGLIDADRLPE